MNAALRFAGEALAILVVGMLVGLVAVRAYQYEVRRSVCVAEQGQGIEARHC